jgi:hypothetical protein
VSPLIDVLDSSAPPFDDVPLLSKRNQTAIWMPSSLHGKTNPQTHRLRAFFQAVLGERIENQKNLRFQLSAGIGVSHDEFFVMKSGIRPEHQAPRITPFQLHEQLFIFFLQAL